MILRLLVKRSLLWLYCAKMRIGVFGLWRDGETGSLSLSLFPFIVASFHKDFPHVPSPSPLSVFELVTVPVLILTFPFYNRPFFTSKFRAKFWTRRFKRFALEEGIVCFRVGFACGYCTLISRQLSARINNTNEVIQFLRLCLKRRLLIFSFFFFIYSWNIIGNNFIFFFLISWTAQPIVLFISYLFSILGKSCFRSTFFNVNPEKRMLNAGRSNKMLIKNANKT